MKRGVIWLSRYRYHIKDGGRGCGRRRTTAHHSAAAGPLNLDGQLMLRL